MTKTEFLDLPEDVLHDQFDVPFIRGPLLDQKESIRKGETIPGMMVFYMVYKSNPSEEFKNGLTLQVLSTILDDDSSTESINISNTGEVIMK